MRAFLPTLLLLVVAAACSPSEEARRGDAELALRVTMDPSPTASGLSAVQVLVAEEDWTPRNGARVFLTGHRDGHAVVRDTAVGRGAGLYLADSVRFPQAGDWVLTVRVEIPGGRWVETDRTVTVDDGEPS